jgi:hypothetical protein
MDDFSLVPVEHQPDFADVSLVPVEHDPFGPDGVTQPAQAQARAQAQQEQIQGEPAPSLLQPAQFQTTQFQPTRTQSQSPPQLVQSAQPKPTIPGGNTIGGDSGSPFVDFFNQLAAPERAESERVADLVQNHPTAAKIVGAIGLGSALAPPLAIAGSEALGLFGAGAAGTAATDGLAGSTISGAGRIAAGSAAGVVAKDVVPAAEEAGAKAVARGVARKTTDGHHPFVKYLGGAVKQELVELPRSLHVEFHRRLDRVVPKQKGTAHYQSLGPEKRREALQGLANVTKEFDADYGTNLYDALLKNGFPEP